MYCSLSEYSIGYEIGRGTFAICYKVTHRVTSEEFVLKKVPLQASQSDEFSILQTISHPNVLRLIASFSDLSHLYVVTEYTRSIDLEQLIQKRKVQQKPFSPMEIDKIGKGMIEGTLALHRNSIIHRDIKPSNILINEQLEVKIGDFGSAKRVDADLNWTRVGTPLYLCPEIIKCEGYGYKADVWSIGCTLFYLSTFRHAFEASNIIQLGASIVNQCPRLDLLGPSVRPLIQDMLRKNESDRLSLEEIKQKYLSNVQSEHIRQPSQEIVQSHLPTSSQTSQVQHSNLSHLPILSKYQRFPKDKFGKGRYSIDLSSEGKDEQLGRVEVSPKGSQLVRGSNSTIQDKKSEQWSKQSLDDETIILKVDPKDFDHFKGYYRNSINRDTKIQFDNVHSKQKDLKVGRKSSIFKILPQKCNQESKFGNKENCDTVKHKESTKRRNDIFKAQHQEMMMKLKRKKKEKQIISRMVEVDKPQIVLLHFK